MTWLDHALVFMFAVGYPVWAYVDYQRLKARVRAGICGARLAAYADGMLSQWLLVSAVVALWIHSGRAFVEIGFSAPVTRDFLLALAAATAMGALLLLQSAHVVRRPETHAQVRGTMVKFVEVLPVQRTDLTGFIAMSVTAGICEEILFRGVLGWYFGHWLGPWAAHGVAVAIFGVAHLYQGPTGAARSALAGAVMAGLYLWSGSLLPSMLAHALVDITSGWMAYEVLRERGSETAAAG